LRFEQRQYQGSVGVSNSASRSLGRTRAEAKVDVYALLGGFDRTGFSLASSGNAKYNALLLDHERAIGASGLKALAKLKALESRPGKKANRNLETRSREAELGLSYPILRSRSKNFYLSGTLSAHDGEIDLPELRSSKDRTRSVRLAASFDATDRWQGVNTIELGLTQGLRGLGASDNGSAQVSRTQGRSDFTKLTLYAARLQALRDQWSLLGAVSGQYGFNDLLVPELFAFGGEQFGRGYDAAEIAGDHGAAAKVELRYSGAKPQVGLSAYTLYGFWDGGKVWMRSPSAERGEKAKQSAASAGVGARMNIGTSATTFVELAKPLTREVEQEGNKQARLFAGVNYRF
jgi:hemolysin activation/secretion protein